MGLESIRRSLLPVWKFPGKIRGDLAHFVEIPARRGFREQFLKLSTSLCVALFHRNLFYLDAARALL